MNTNAIVWQVLLVLVVVSLLVAAWKKRPRLTELLPPPDGDIRDVVVVGGGCAGCCAALAAANSGARVLLLEASKSGLGGTSARSGGYIWIPNSNEKRQKGGTETRQGFVNFVREAKGMQLTMLETARAGSFWENAPRALATMQKLGLQVAPARLVTGRGLEATRAICRRRNQPVELADVLPDYIQAGNDSGVGRTFAPAQNLYNLPGQLPTLLATYGLSLLRYLPDLLRSKFTKQGTGFDLMANLSNLVYRHPNCTVLLGRRVQDLRILQDHHWLLTTADGQSLVARSVVLCAGGSGWNKCAVQNAARFPVRGSCAAPEARGDLQTALQRLTGRTQTGPSGLWLKQVWYARSDAAQRPGSFVHSREGIWFVSGSSYFIVSRLGRRFCNEAEAYPQRGAKQVTENTPAAIYICDHHNRKHYASFRAVGGVLPAEPLPGVGSEPAFVHRCENWQDVVHKCHQELTRFSLSTVSEEQFARQLNQTRDVFNRDAEQGHDSLFGRGQLTSADRAWVTIAKEDEDRPNPLLRPLSDTGPYYVVLLGVGALDTVGTAVTDAAGRVLNTNGLPLPGLWAAGNTATPILDTGVYFSGGFTLGHALTSGAVAGEAAAAQLARVPALCKLPSVP